MNVRLRISGVMGKYDKNVTKAVKEHFLYLSYLFLLLNSSIKTISLFNYKPYDMSTTTLILCIILTAIIISSVWNALNFRILRSSSEYNKRELNDSKYWELKYKYEYLIAVVAIISAVIAYIGYNTKDSLERNLKIEFTAKIDSTNKRFSDQVIKLNDSLKIVRESYLKFNKNLSSAKVEISSTTEKITGLNLNQRQLLENANLTSKQIKRVQDTVLEMNKKNLLRQEFYVITGLKGADMDPGVLFKFKDLITTSGDHLPVFKKAPLVMPFGGKNLIYSIVRTTSEEVVVHFNGISEQDKENMNPDYSLKNYPLILLIYEIR